jgi:PAS domain S-box-containing protein
VQQLERLYPLLTQSQPPQAATLSQQVDAISLAKAQQAISSEIHLDRITQTLLRIVMESAGAQTSYLSVEGAGQLRAEMQADDNGSQRIVFDSMPRAEKIPETIINYIRHSRKTVILTDASTTPGEFSADDYLRRVKPRSVLGMAIQRREKLLAVLYLENNLVSGAFTSERRTVLEVLAAQTAISLETAGVYEMLRESDERLRLTLEATQIGIFDWDVEHDHFYLSPEYYTMLGYEPKKGPGDREEWLERVHPDDRPHVVAKIQEAMARDSSSGQTREYAYEARLRHADGTYRWQLVKGFGVKRDQEGRVTRTLGVRMDINERKRAEEERQNAERQLRTIMTNFPDFISRFDEQCRFIYVNPAIEKRLGFSLEQCFGKTLFDIDAPGPSGQNEKLTAAIKQAYKQGSPNIVEAVWPTPMGERIFEVRHIPEINNHGTVVSVIGVTRDITERRQAEEEIAWNLAINQALSSLYIPLVASGTSIEQIAKAVLEKSRQLTSSTYGYVGEIDPKSGDLIAHTNINMMQTECAIIEEDRKIRFPRGADGLYNGLWGYALNTKEPLYTDEPVKHPSSVGIPEGHIVIKRFLSVPVLLAGELVGQIALSNSTRAYTDRDVDAINRLAEFYALAIQHTRAEQELRTHRDHLEELVKQRAAELTIARDVAEEARWLAEDANKAKSIFLANISHELRTPLNAILGYSQLMQRDSSLLPEQQEYLNTINRSGEHLLGLINDVLEISKIEAGQVTLDVATFDLGAFLDDLEDMFRVRTDAKGLQLDFIGIHDVPRYLESDENKLRQILINVLGNAVKFTKHGSVILRVSIKGMDQEPVRKDRKYLCFEVEDTGVGIAEEELDKVFAAFEQTESGRMSKTGTGLGMAITQNYVHMMGGDITVVSTPGEGCIFRFSISVSEGNQVDIKEQTMLQRRVIGLEPGQDVPRIFVVEDMDESRTMLVKLLRIVGMHVQEAVNGKQALEIFQQWQPSFIWMDIRMPVMDGLEATRRIKETEAGKSTIVAALTAHALEEERKQIIAAGCDDVVRKPLREQDIFDVMKNHLGLKYVYEGVWEETVPVKSKVEIDPEQLAALPDELLNQLYQAVLELNEQQSLALIEKIKPIDVQIARELDVLVRNFAFDTLQELLNRSEQSTPGDTHD